MQRRFHGPPTTFVVLAVAVIQVLGTVFAAARQPEHRPLDVLAFVLLLAGPAALALRRSAFMDIRMPDGDGLSATRQILTAQGLEHTRIIILTTFELDEYISEAVRSGAAGFLVKDSEPEELIRAVRVVHDGDALLSPPVTRRIMAKLAVQSRAAANTARLDGITERERAASPGSTPAGGNDSRGPTRRSAAGRDST